MKFIHTDLGNRRRGEIVEVALTRAANVRLMNTEVDPKNRTAS